MSKPPDISFDDAAAKDISEEDLQRLHEQGHQVEDVEKDVEEIKDDPRTPVHEIVGDDFIYVERHGRKVAIGVDREELQAQLGIGAGGGGGTDFFTAGRVAIIAVTNAAGPTDARGNSVKWHYTIIEQKPGPTVGTFVNDPDGYTGLAYNLKEVNNTGVGIQGNGVDHDGPAYPPGFAMRPIREYIFFRTVTFANGDIAGVFSESNTEDGDCSGSGSDS